jgi:hypothetical protein
MPADKIKIPHKNMIEKQSIVATSDLFYFHSIVLLVLNGIFLNGEHSLEN